MTYVFAYVLGLLFLRQAAAIEVQVDTARLLSEIEELASHNDLAAPAVQRILYTPADLSARSYLKTLFESANLTVRVDALGNQFAVWQGTHTSRSGAVGTGSHIDAIPHSGMYDGVLGVLGAVEAVRALARAGFNPVRDIHIIAFTSEEPTRFGLGCIGSRVLSGALRADTVAALTDTEGTTLDQARIAAGFEGKIAHIVLPNDAYSAFIELHIEQADFLEKSRLNIGAVTAIAAPAQVNVRFTGSGGHAGALPMAERHDPSLAGAELALEVEKAALDAGSTYSVGTTGKFEVFPGAVNSVPRVVQLGIDVRDIDLGRRGEILSRVKAAAEIIANRRGVGVEFHVLNADSPANCSHRIVETIERSAREHKLHVTRLVSRAYHDSLFMAKKFPTGMIFVPCRGGISHRPEEFVSPEDIENGVQTLAKTVAHLAGAEGRQEIRDEL